MDFTKQYENGLKIAVKEVPGSYSLSVGICIGVGSCFEDKSTNGFSHFVEHMMFKGTPKRTAFEISDAIDCIGGQINAFTSKDLTCYYAKVAAVHAEKSVEILSDMLLNSLFDANELMRERKVIQEEITMGDDMPDEVCHDMIATALFGEHALGQTIIGESEQIGRTTREDLLRFVDKFYVADNIVISFAGNISVDEASKYVEKYFVPFFEKSKTEFELKKADYQSKYLTKVKDVEQAHLSIGFEGLPMGDENMAAYSVFVSIFGSGMSSRLFQKIREEHGMAYTVYAYPSNYKNNGYLEIYAGTNPKNINEVLDLIKIEIDKILVDGITDDEFLRGKEQLKGGTLLAQESSTTVMTNIGKYYLFMDKKYTVEEKIQQINAVQKEDVAKIIKQVLNRKNASLAIVSKTEPDKDLLEKFKS